MTMQILIQVSQWSLIIFVGVAFMFGLGAFIYDIRAIASRHGELKARRQNNTLRVTVLVYARNNHTTIGACLASIANSTYRKYDIVVIDDRSTDATRRIVTGYCRRHPFERLYVFEKRVAGHRLGTFQQGYDKSSKGDIVLVINGTTCIPPTLLGSVVAIFSDNQQLRALRLNESSPDATNPAQVCLRLLQLSRNVVLKSASLVSAGRILAAQPNTVYRKAAFEANDTKMRIPYTYQSSVYVVGVSVWAKHKLPALAVLIFTTFYMYGAATLQTATLLQFSWLAVSSWLILAIWSDDVSTSRHKGTLMFCLPVAYFLLYAYFLVQIVYMGAKYVVIKTSPLIIIGHDAVNVAERKL